MRANFNFQARNRYVSASVQHQEWPVETATKNLPSTVQCKKCNMTLFCLSLLVNGGPFDAVIFATIFDQHSHLFAPCSSMPHGPWLSKQRMHLRKRKTVHSHTITQLTKPTKTRFTLLPVNLVQGRYNDFSR